MVKKECKLPEPFPGDFNCTDVFSSVHIFVSTRRNPRIQPAINRLANNLIIEISNMWINIVCVLIPECYILYSFAYICIWCFYGQVVLKKK